MIAQCLVEQSGRTVDAVVIVPASGEAGRLTVGGVHYAGTAESGLVPVGETEFARDATFGYISSDLCEWVEEKTHCRRRAADVVALTLDVLRAGPEAVARVLSPLTGGAPVVDGLNGGNVVIGTSRTLVTGADGASSLDIARLALGTVRRPCTRHPVHRLRWERRR